MRACSQLFDPEDKGHISSDDLHRVCNQLGYKVTERDVDNMLSVLAPSNAISADFDGGPDGRGGGGGGSGGGGDGGAHAHPSRAISFDKFAKMMESSYRRTFTAGEAIFWEGDAVDGFYIVVSGECSVQATARPNTPPAEITKLGPGDFFGETGLLEGRGTRNSTVLCNTPVEVLMIDNAMFLHLTGSPAGSAGAEISGRMRERAEARQRSRLNRAIEMMQSTPLQQQRFVKGDVLFRQGEPATHFYIVKSGDLQISFVSSTNEEAELGHLHAGDQFGYDAVLGELHDTTVRCLTNAEVIAVPREQLQKGLSTSSETYLQSVWQAPAQRSIRLRRQLSQALHSDARSVARGGGGGGGADGAGSATAPAGREASLGGKSGEGGLRRYGSSAGGEIRLPSADFNVLLRRSRLCRLSEGEAAFEQGSTPMGVYLLSEGRCQVGAHYTRLRRPLHPVQRTSARPPPSPPPPPIYPLLSAPLPPSAAVGRAQLLQLLQLSSSCSSCSSCICTCACACSAPPALPLTHPSPPPLAPFAFGLAHLVQVEHASKLDTRGEVVGQLSQGDHFGEGALLEGRDRRNCTVRCIHPEGCAVGVLSKGAFEAMLSAEPKLYDAFEDSFARRNRVRLRSVIQTAAEREEATPRTLHAGEVLFRQGEAADAFFLVDSGAVQMSYLTADGRQLPSKTHRAGDIFGASGLLAGSRLRRDTATALEPTTLRAIPHARFSAIMRQDSLIAEGLRRAATDVARPGESGASGSITSGERRQVRAGYDG